MSSTTTTAESISQETIDAYRCDGFVPIRSVLTREEAADYYEAALAAAERQAEQDNRGGDIFKQLVNIWLEDNTLRRVTLEPRIGAIAQKLAGVKLRLWHDHLLIKMPHNQAPTEFHQDRPYWPHANAPNTISVWIALCDVPAEKGCMQFIVGSHRYTDLPTQRLNDPRSLMTICPQLEWKPRVTIPLQAGDCTFHHCRAAHSASANTTDDPRVAHVIIYMDSTVTYNQAPHVVTDPLHPTQGAPLIGEWFPAVDDFESVRCSQTR